MASTPPRRRPALVRLPRAFASRYDSPVIDRVDPRMFRTRYFTHCLQCGFCHDWCCQYGVDVDEVHYRQILAHADHLERYTGIPRDQWFTDEYEEDPEVPGGASHRTGADEGGCVFLRRAGRGCLLHAFCLEAGVPFRELKSMVDCLFPVTFADGVLSVADEVADGSLVCLDTGPSVYRGVREDVEYYFGAACVEALDAVEASVLGREAAITP